MTAKLMKGKTWKEGKDRLTYPATAEIKYDEIRCDVRHAPEKILFQSYADKPLANMDFLGEQLRCVMQEFRIERLDCGVLVNRNYGDSYKWTRTSKNGEPEHLGKAQVQLVLFDVPQWGGHPYDVRRSMVDEVAWAGKSGGVPFLRPYRLKVEDEQAVDDAFTWALANKYEGLMVKSHAGLYIPGKRSFDWLKYKPEEDADGIVRGIKEAVSEAGEPLGRVGSLQVECEDGSTASVAGIEHDLAKAMFIDPSIIVGKWVEFQYMMRDRQGGYRHPRFHRIREDKV